MGLEDDCRVGILLYISVLIDDWVVQGVRGLISNMYFRILMEKDDVKRACCLVVCKEIRMV